MKQMLKRVPGAAWLNARFKSQRTKQRYQALCREYGTPSVLSQPGAIAELARARWSSVPSASNRPAASRPRVLFVGTDAQQDYSGCIQALQSLTELTVFEHEPGKHGQRWPASPREFEAVRVHNGSVLRRYMNEHDFDLIVGQMWGVSMDWKALAVARGRGIAVVNIAMDDRHAFTFGRLADGSDGGTRGLASVLSLACSAAPECVAWHEAEGCPAIFFPEASDPEIFSAGDGTTTVDVSFVGARYGIRERLVNALVRSGVKVEPWGSGWPNGRIATEKIPDLFARSRVVLGCGTIGHTDDFVALKMRDFDVPMTGAMYITHRNPDLEALYDVGREIVVFDTADDLVDKTRYYLNAEKQRREIAAAGHLRAAREHTWTNRIRLLLDGISRNN